jgi:hydroxyacylglutathione hydrolase
MEEVDEENGGEDSLASVEQGHPSGYSDLEERALEGVRPPSPLAPLVALASHLQNILLSLLSAVHFALFSVLHPLVLLLPSVVRDALASKIFRIGYLLYLTRVGLWIHKRLVKMSQSSRSHKCTMGEMGVYSSCVTFAVPILFDNLAYILLDRFSFKAAVVDPSDPLPILRTVNAYNYSIEAALITHRHHDHSGGTGELLKHFPNMRVIRAQGEPVPHATDRFAEGHEFSVGTMSFRLIVTCGHSYAHASFVLLSARRCAIDEAECCFTGDALFNGGIGALFHGGASSAVASMDKLSALPDRAEIYPGHEYSVSTLNFANWLEPTKTCVRICIEQLCF